MFPKALTRESDMLETTASQLSQVSAEVIAYFMDLQLPKS